MDASELEAKAYLKAELAAKSSRIVDLEAKVSLLEAENALLRKAMSKGEAMDHSDKEGPSFGRLEEDLGRSKRRPIEMAGGRVASDATESNDDDEEGMASSMFKGRGTEEDRSCAMGVVTGESKDEDQIEDTEVADGGDHRSVHFADNVDLEDDDVLITPRGNKRAAARVITSDSEDEDGDGGEHGNGKDSELLVQQEEVGVAPCRKRALRGVSDCDNEDGSEDAPAVSQENLPCVVSTEIDNDEEEDEDDIIPIREVLKKMRKERVTEVDGELGEMEGCSIPTTRRSARLAKNQSKRVQAAHPVFDFVESQDDEESGGDMDEDDGNDGELGVAGGCSTPATRRPAQLTKRQSKRVQTSHLVLDFVEHKDDEESDGDSEGHDGMDEFIDDEDCSEDSANSAEEPSAEPEESDNEVNYKDVMASMGRRRHAKDWEYETDMLSAFAEQPELCLKAVCALYRKQTEKEDAGWLMKQGFNRLDAGRASHTAEFLLDGDAFGPLKKTVHDLEKYDRSGLKFCHKIAARYSKQLFAIYQKKEDPNFP